MSSQPECTKCGDYLSHGPCLCNSCASRLRAMNEKLLQDQLDQNARMQDTENEMEEARWRNAKRITSLMAEVAKLTTENDRLRKIEALWKAHTGIGSEHGP